MRGVGKGMISFIRLFIGIIKTALHPNYGMEMRNIDFSLDDSIPVLTQHNKLIHNKQKGIKNEN